MNQDFTLQGWIEAFEIFKKYDNDADVAAEHDEFYVCLKPETVSQEDKNRLTQLGWFDDGDYCFIRNV